MAVRVLITSKEEYWICI